MKEKLSYDSEGNYHDDDVRLNNYTESADMPILERTDIAQTDFNAHIKKDIDPQLIETVVARVQREVGTQIVQNPKLETHEIKSLARNRFMDLLEKDLLTQKEAERCYQRFVHLVDYYYGI